MFYCQISLVLKYFNNDKFLNLKLLTILKVNSTKIICCYTQQYLFDWCCTYVHHVIDKCGGIGEGAKENPNIIWYVTRLL